MQYSAVQSVTNTFSDQIRILNIIRFLEITEYQILNTIRYWQNPNIEYQISRISQHRVQIVLFDLTIRIPNAKYQIVYKMLEKIKLKWRYLFHARHFVLKICETMRTGIWSNYSNTQLLFGVLKNVNTEYRIIFDIEKIQIPNTNTTIHPTIWIVFECQITRHTLGQCSAVIYTVH